MFIYARDNVDSKQDRQSTYKFNNQEHSRYVLLRLKNNEYCTFWVCVCILSYSARLVHGPHYIVICGQSGSTRIVYVIPHKAPL